MILAVSLAVNVAAGCGSDPGSPPPDPTAGVDRYIGSWTHNGTSGTRDATKSVIITNDLAYTQTIQQYESAAKVAPASAREVEAAVTAISVDENNPDYDTIFIDINAVRVTPSSAAQADEWNTAEYGGLTTWVQQTTRTFSSADPGFWEHGAIWQSHSAMSVRREGDLLTVNERGGFDGQDPPEDVYFLD